MSRLAAGWPLAAVTAGALALRGWWLLALPGGVERDGATYARLAENLARGAGYRDLTGSLHTLFPPGYPLAAAPLVLILGDGERAGRAVSLLAGLALVILTYLIARRLWGPLAATCAAGLVAVHPRLVEVSTAVLSQSLYACVLYALTLAMLATLHSPRPPATRLGLGFALLACIRPDGYLVALAAVIALAVAAQGRVRSVVAFVAAMAVPVGLYSAYLWTVSGQLLTGKWSNLALGPPGVPFGERYVRNLFDLEAKLAVELSLLVIAAAAVGALVVARTRSRATSTFLLLSLGLPLAAIPTFAVDGHFLAASLPLVLVLAVAPLATDATWSRPRAWVATACVLVAVLHGIPALSYPLRASRWGDIQMTEHRAMGRWILERHGPGRRILTRAPETVYDARGEWRLLPDIVPGDVAAEAQRTGSQLIVIDELLTRRYQPRLLPLLAGDPPSPLRLRHEMAPHPGRRIRLFTIAD